MNSKNQKNQQETNAGGKENAQGETNAQGKANVQGEVNSQGETNAQKRVNVQGARSASHVILPGSTRMLRPGARVLGVAGPEEWIEIIVKIRRRKPLPDITGRPQE